MIEPYIHSHALVETDQIGTGTRIWAFVHILKGAIIGKDCNICDHCYIEHDVAIGNNVTIKSGIYIWENTTIEDDVFLGPNVVFTNNPRPRSKQYIEHLKTHIKQGASVGANSTILGGVTIGRYAMTGIGSVITRDVADHALVYGNPARVKGWIDETGNPLYENTEGYFTNEKGKLFQRTPNGLCALNELPNN
jgi:acetyltransferase-like isoleucine patch superfamily enzyme